MKHPLSRALRSAGLDAVDVAARLNVDPKTVDRWLGGRLPYPRHRATLVTINAGTLRANDSTAAEVVGRFDALVRFAGLKLGRRLGTDIVPALGRRELADPTIRTQSLVAQLTSTGAMTAALRIPGAVGALSVTADLRAAQITCHVDVDAPREGRPTTRVNWLVRQLKDAPATVRLESFAAYSRGPGSAELLKTVRENPVALVGDLSKEIKSFRVAMNSPAGTKRGTGRGAFIDSVLAAIDSFYEQVIQNLKPWMPAPPKLRSADEVVEAEPVSKALVSTAISSQDGPLPEVDRPRTAPSGDDMTMSTSP